MKKVCLLILLVILLGIGLNVEALKTVDSTSGIIHFRDGHETAFIEMGLRTAPLIYKVEGKLNARDVTYYFSELSQLHFVDRNKGYYTSRSGEHTGDIRIVDRAGSSFVLNDAYIEIGYLKAPEISYRYLDHAENVYKWRNSEILNNIGYIKFD